MWSRCPPPGVYRSPTGICPVEQVQTGRGPVVDRDRDRGRTWTGDGPARRVRSSRGRGGGGSSRNSFVIPRGTLQNWDGIQGGSKEDPRRIQGGFQTFRHLEEVRPVLLVSSSEPGPNPALI